MTINNKIIFAKTKSGFEAIKSNIPQGLDPIVFIQDSKEIWTCGTYFSLGDSAIFVEEDIGSLKLHIGDQSVDFSTTGESLAISKGEGNSIIISSSALTKIKTDNPLAWDNVDKSLRHVTSGAIKGQYGPTGSVTNASSFRIPSVTIDEYGHVTKIDNYTISIRDNTDQLAPINTPGYKNVLLGQSVNDLNETGPVRKANGLQFNDETQKLLVEGGIDANGSVNITGGDLKVVGGKIIGNLEGDITGEAIPKIHISDLPEFGGASTNLYGHVKLQDTFNGQPAPSDTNTDKANAEVLRGVAASPLLVWNAKEEAKKHSDDKPSIGAVIGNFGSLTIDTPNQELSIHGSNGVKVRIENNDVVIQGIGITAVSVEGTPVGVTDNINYTEDFELDSENNLSIRWLEIK